MASKHVEPAISSVSFSCPHCGALAHQTWHTAFARRLENNAMPLRPTQAGLKMMEVSNDLEEANEEVTEKHREVKRKLLNHARRVYEGELFFDEIFSKLEKLPQVANLHVSDCYACRKIAVWAGDHLVYPPRPTTGPEPNEDLSPDVRRDYDEARAILDASPRGAAALLRLCIQRLCAHLGEPGKNIDDDIASLVKKGLDKRVQQALDIVRVIGNESVHPGTIDMRDNRDVATKLFGLVNLIAEKMITEPKHVEEMYEKVLPENKRKAIEQRDK